MSQNTYLALQPQTAERTKLRDVVAVLFRRRKLLILSFLGTLLGATAAILIIPNQYQAELKIMLQHNRVDAAVSPDPVSGQQARDVTEQDVNTEVDLIKSRDLLRDVVLATNMQDNVGLLRRVKIALHMDDPRDVRIENAVNSLVKNVEVDPPMKSNVMTALYPSSDPKFSAQLLNTLGKLYVDKHLNAHKGPDASEMFTQEAEKYRQELMEKQKALADFNQREGVISASAEKDAALQKLTQFESQARETDVQIAAIRERIRGLEDQKQKVPERKTTQVRTPSQLLETLNATLYNLELKRTELLQKYAPTYRPVQDLDKQIEETKRSIAKVQSSPLQETTTDGNPTYDWISSETAKATTELAGLQAQAKANRAQIALYRTRAEELERKGIAQADLQRAAKTADENFLLYTRKREEARLNNALDQQRIVNATIAEWAYVPAVPMISPLLKALLSVLLAGMVSLGLVFARDYWDPSFRTPDELQQYLNVSVIAAIPQGETLVVQTRDGKAAAAGEVRSA